ncbi:MAG: hypothetical protein ACLTDV_07455 [Eubacterium sp.]
MNDVLNKIVAKTNAHSVDFSISPSTLKLWPGTIIREMVASVVLRKWVNAMNKARSQK